MKRGYVFFIFLIVGLLIQIVSVYARTEEDWKNGAAWSDLTGYIGRYDHENRLLDDPRVHEKLSALLTKEEITHLKKNLNVRAPIGVDAEHCLTLAGNAPHKGGKEEGFVSVCLFTGTVHVAIFSDETVKVYTARPNDPYDSLPSGFIGSIFLSKKYDFRKKPSYVEVMGADRQ
jgi:hypothetical protein